MSRPLPKVDEFGRHEPYMDGTPVEVVTSIHRFLRETLFWKCEGLNEELLRFSPVPSGTCLLGILKHSGCGPAVVALARHWRPSPGRQRAS